MIRGIPKTEHRFDIVMTAVNHRRSQSGGKTLAKKELFEILDNEGISRENWYTACAYAKSKMPNTYAMFQKAFGREVDVASSGDTPLESIGLRCVSEEEETTEEEIVEEDQEVEVVSPADVLSSIVGWLEKVEPDDRKRILSSASVFYGISLEA